MIVGFSGSRHGLTEAQCDALQALFQCLRPTELHHGDCVGADSEAHQIVRLACPEVRRVAHPPAYSALRARTDAEEYLPAREFLERNQDIVDACEVLVACPSGPQEERRSGTWATVRRARKAGKTVWLVYPDGTMTEEPA